MPNSGIVLVYWLKTIITYRLDNQYHDLYECSLATYVKLEYDYQGNLKLMSCFNNTLQNCKDLPYGHFSVLP